MTWMSLRLDIFKRAQLPNGRARVGWQQGVTQTLHISKQGFLKGTAAGALGFLFQSVQLSR